MIEVNQRIVIPDNEIELKVSSSSGPGGQNVNRVRTRVTLFFDVGASMSLGDSDRELILTRLKTRITKAGVLQVSSQRHRTQEQNRTAAEFRLTELLREALKCRKVRRPTRVSKTSRRRRVDEKKFRSRLKRLRSEPAEED